MKSYKESVPGVHGWNAIVSHIYFLRVEAMHCESRKRAMRLFAKADKLWYKYQYLIG